MTTIDIGQALGILGAYFAVLLVLAVAIETILEPISLFKGLRRQVSPDDFMKDVKDWLPDKSPAATQAASITAFMNEYGATVDDLTSRVEKLKTVVDDTSKAFGTDTIIGDAEKKLAIYLAEIRKKYNLDERKRIAILRGVSAAIGIGLALWLQIDSFSLLKDLLPKSFIVDPLLGMIVTGLAASAGSSFWHDMLGRVRAAKEASQQVQEITAKK